MVPELEKLHGRRVLAGPSRAPGVFRVADVPASHAIARRRAIWRTGGAWSQRSATRRRVGVARASIRSDAFVPCKRADTVLRHIPPLRPSTSPTSSTPSARSGPPSTTGASRASRATGPLPLRGDVHARDVHSRAMLSGLPAVSPSPASPLPSGAGSGWSHTQRELPPTQTPAESSPHGGSYHRRSRQLPSPSQRPEGNWPSQHHEASAVRGAGDAEPRPAPTALSSGIPGLRDSPRAPPTSPTCPAPGWAIGAALALYR